MTVPETNSTYLYFICFIATIGGLMFGFDIAFISGAVPFIQPYFGWDELQLGWGVSSLLVGAIIGAFGSGVLTDRYGRKVILLAVFVQISGINTVIDYAPKILLSADVEIKNALLQTSLIGLINGLFALVAIFLIDKVGRRMLYLVGFIEMTVTLLVLALSFYLALNGVFILICILLFFAFFASCIGPAFWTLVSEMFPNRARGKAIAFAPFKYNVIYLYEFQRKP
jgi:MFS family permease